MRSVLFALLFAAAPAVAGEPLRLGEVQSVRAGAAYELFLPANYDPAKRWPYIHIAGGDAATLTQFAPAAAKYGYAVTRSNVAATGEVWRDARRRLRIDNSRAYLVLYGHAAEAADVAAIDGVAGVAVVNAVPANIDAPTVFFSIGNHDSRYIEMRQLSQLTREQRRRVGVDHFEGAEITAEAAGRVIEWFHLDALEQGVAVVSADDVQAIVDSWTAAAAQLESSDPLRAVSLYNVIVSSFSAVTSTARTRSSALASSLAYGRAEYAEKRALRWEAAAKERVAKNTARPPRDAAAFLDSINIRDIVGKRTSESAPLRNAAIRVLHYATALAEQQASAGAGRHDFWRSVVAGLR